MNPKTPRDLLVDLSKDDANGRALRDRIKNDPKAALAEYGVTVKDEHLPADPPPHHQKVEKQLRTLDQQGLSSNEWEAHALLIGVIGAIPFVATDSR